MYCILLLERNNHMYFTSLILVLLILTIFVIRIAIWGGRCPFCKSICTVYIHKTREDPRHPDKVWISEEHTCKRCRYHWQTSDTLVSRRSCRYMEQDEA